MSALDYGPPRGPEEREAYLPLLCQAFHGTRERYLAWLANFADEHLRLLRESGEVVAGLALYVGRQHFGGRAVPMHGVAGVAVPAHLRGRGYASELMARLAHELGEARVALSTLYPATVALYRRAGWELAGARQRYRLDLAALTTRAPDVELEPLDAGGAPLARELYERTARAQNGHLERLEVHWERALAVPEGETREGFLARQEGVPVGYLYQRQLDPGPESPRHRVQVLDHAFANAAGGRALLALLARHRSLHASASLQAGPQEAFAHLLPEAALVEERRLDWMLRIGDLRAALEARGWPEGVELSVELEVADEHVPGNHGAFRLQVCGGEARVEPARSAALRIDVRGLAALYSSRRSPAELERVGLLTGPERGLARLATLFAGPAPWMPDFF